MKNPNSLLFDLLISSLEANILSILITVFIVGVVASWIIGRWTLKVGTGLKQFEKATSWLKKIHDLASEHLSKQVRESASPIRLTRLGQNIVKGLEPTNWLDLYAQQRLPRIQKMSLYQIQRDAFHFAENELLDRIQSDDPQRLKDIENCAFRHGVNVAQVMEALGVVLRDKIFELTRQSIEDIPPSSPPSESAG